MQVRILDIVYATSLAIFLKLQMAEVHSWNGAINHVIFGMATEISSGPLSYQKI